MPLVIAGPTAGGKSGLALKLAQKHRGEIICADSRQFYARMAIGTACPTKEEMGKVVHHGYGLIDPKSQKIDAGFFIRYALEKIKEIQARNNRPILVGGTGLYLRSLHYGLGDVPPSDKNVSDMLLNRLKIEGIEKLYQELKKIDEKTASKISPNDSYRIMRALEIYLLTKKPPSVLRESFNQGPKLLAHWVYKKPEKTLLLENITSRVKHMFQAGLLDEAEKLGQYLPKDHWALKVMGYEEALAFIHKEITLEKAIEKTIILHRQYAKRQYTWFNKESFYRFIV